MEIFGMDVRVRLVISNLNEIVEQIKNKIRDVIIKVSGKVEGLADNIKKEVSEGFRRGVTGIGGTISDILGEASGTLGNIFDRFTGLGVSLGKLFGGGAPTGAGAGMGAVAGALGIIAGVATTAIFIIKEINERIGKMYQTLKDASPSFKGTKELLEKTFNLALKPMGDVMTMLMRPYLILSMQYMRTKVGEMYEVIKGAGGKITPEVMTKLKGIWESTMEGLSYIAQQMGSVIQPFASAMEGYLSALGIVYNNWLTGISDWFTSFLEGLKTGIESKFKGMPSDLANWIVDTTKKNPSFLENVPKNITDSFYTWIAINRSYLEELPTKVANDWYTWSTSDLNIFKLTALGVGAIWGATATGSDVLEDIKTKIKDAFGTIQDTLTSDDLLNRGKKVVNDFIDKIASMLQVTAPPPTGGALPTGLTVTEATKYAEKYGVMPTPIGKVTTADIANAVTSAVTSASRAVVTSTQPWYQPIVNFGNTVVNSIGNFVSSVGKILGFQAGTSFVPTTGPAILHRGEAVLTTTEARGYREGGQKTIIMKPTYIFSGEIKRDVDVDDLIRRSHRVSEIDMRRRGLI